jgi:flagellar hook protein FlgE
MSFQQGLSGLSSAQRALDATSNNIANASTVGFKLSNTQFADVFAASLGGLASSQIGAGTAINNVVQQFSQGNITVTNNPLDVAINGSGFFRMSNNGAVSYARNGQFQVDKDGFIVNAQGLHLTGFGASPTGAIVPGSLVDLQIQAGDIPPRTTSLSTWVLNLASSAKPPDAMTRGTLTGSGAVGSTTITAGSNDGLTLTLDGGAPVNVTIPPGTYTNDTLAAAVQAAIAAALPPGQSATVSVDADGIMTIASGTVGNGSGVTVSGSGAANLLGAAPTAKAGADNFSITDSNSFSYTASQTVYDSKGNPHNFAMYFAKTSQEGQWQIYTSLDGVTTGTATNLAFDSTGNLTTTMPLTESFALTNGATSPMSFSLDLGGTTEFGNAFGQSRNGQDGFASGVLMGISIAPDGVIQGRYTNSQSRNLGQIALANFNNVNGLVSLGGSQWGETVQSGQPVVGPPGSSSLGVLQSAAIEESNVDITAELVNMITQQRNYQANAQSIKTQDQLLQTMVNLR